MIFLKALNQILMVFLIILPNSLKQILKHSTHLSNKNDLKYVNLNTYLHKLK